MRRPKQRHSRDPAELFGRPGCQRVIGGIVGKVGQAGPVTVHHVYLVIGLIIKGRTKGRTERDAACEVFRCEERSRLHGQGIIN